MTRKQITKRYDQIIRQCFRDMKGGLEYGMDWPTLRITFPERYAEIKALREAFHTAEK
jgi:hypothetical protein